MSGTHVHRKENRSSMWCVLESPLKGFCETSRKFGLGLLRSHGARRHRVSSRKLSRKQWRKQTARGICSLFCDIRLVHISAFRDTKAHARTHPRTGKQAHRHRSHSFFHSCFRTHKTKSVSLSHTGALTHAHLHLHTHTHTHAACCLNCIAGCCLSELPPRKVRVSSA
mgnify:CR=1 FL=1